MIRWAGHVSLAAALSGAGCSGTAAVDGALPATTLLPPTASPATTAAGGSADRAAQRPVRANVAYDDVTGARRVIQVEVRPAAGGPSAAAGDPVLVWSHGGSTGKTSTARVGVEWSDAVRPRGYAFVAIAHPARDAASTAQVCAAVGTTDCSMFNPLLWDRPHDVVAVLDWLEVEVAAGRLSLDLERLAYGGHSAGAVGVMVTAGMVWPFDSVAVPPADPRPDAFIVASPPGTDTRRLAAGALDAIDRPVLMLSGAGDTTDGTVAADRFATFALFPADAPAAFVWVDDPTTRHTTFDLSPDSCRRAGGSMDRCSEITRALGRVGVAFLDSALDNGREGFDLAGLSAEVAARLPDGFSWHTPMPD
jgi:hypothetical protein